MKTGETLLSFVFSTANDSGGDAQIPQSFLPFGPDHGDLTVPTTDDGATDEISLEADVVILGSSHNRLYVSCDDEPNTFSVYVLS